MTIEHVGGRYRIAAVRPTSSERWGCKVVRGFILVAIAAAWHVTPVQAQQNGVVLSHNVGITIQRQAYPEDLDLPHLVEHLSAEITLWGYKGSQPDVVCMGHMVVGEEELRPHPACPWSGYSNDPRNVRARSTSKTSPFGVLASVEISAQITNMDENLFRVAGRFRTEVKVETTPEYRRSVESMARWGMLLTIKRPMKVIISGCELFDTRFLPIQYARVEGAGHVTCAFEITDVDQYNVAGPTPNVAGRSPAAGMSEEELRAQMGMDEEAWKDFKSMLDAMGQDMGDLLGGGEGDLLGGGEPNDEIWRQVEPSPEIARAAQSRPLTSEETWKKLQEYPPLDKEWIPSDYVEHQIGAHQHEAYEKRRAGDPEALAEQEEFLHWLTVFNESISGRQLMFTLNNAPAIGVSFPEGTSLNPGDKAEKSERFTISMYPIANNE